jgi:hypothetical protein
LSEQGPSRADTTRCITVPERVAHKRVDGEMVILDMDAEHYYGLDEVGTRIWTLLTEHGAVEPAVAGLLAEFDVDERTLRADVARLVDELAAAGLIRVDQAPGA